MSNFNMVPWEIMLEILSRVPTETVLECKLVSKPWKNLIQQPLFSQKHVKHLNDLDSGKSSFVFHTQRSNKEPIYYTEYDEDLNCFSRTTRINLRPPFKDCYILGSCNGLICFNARLDNMSVQPVYICNPITREYILLPEFDGKHLMLTGFGYSSSTNEYKVVRICKDWNDPNYYRIIQVFTLGSGIGWRNVCKMDYDLNSVALHGVYLDGSIHWLDHRARTIIAFDLASEELRELPSPPCFGCLSAIHVFGDFLCVYESRLQDFDIWVLKKNEGNPDMIWSKEFSDIKVTRINFTKSGDLLCYDFRDKNVYRYAPKASSRVLVNFDKDFEFNCGVLHKNTLVSLKALGEVNTLQMDSGERARCSEGTGSSGH